MPDRLRAHDGDRGTARLSGRAVSDLYRVAAGGARRGAGRGHCARTHTCRVRHCRSHQARNRSRALGLHQGHSGTVSGHRGAARQESAYAGPHRVTPSRRPLAQQTRGLPDVAAADA